MNLRRPSLPFLTLIFANVSLAALSAYRVYDFYVTGFIVPDEIGYVHDALSGAIYGTRWFFGYLNITLFRLAGVNTVGAYYVLLPFYLFAWSSLTILFTFLIVKQLGFDEKVQSITVFSAFSLIAFVLLSLGFLTEPLGLAMAMGGVYFLLRFRSAKTARGLVSSAFVSVLFLSAAAGTRQPYAALAIGGVVVVVYACFRRGYLSLPLASERRPILALAMAAYIVPLLIFLEYPSHVLTGQVVPAFDRLFFGVVLNKTVGGHGGGVGGGLGGGGGVPAVGVHGIAQAIHAVWIFFAGLALGWGPIGLLVGFCGFILVIRASLLKGGELARYVLVLSILALITWLGTSFLVAEQASYVTPAHYSTILRFSDTSLPAYFLLSPFIFRILTKKKVRYIPYLAVMVIFLVAAVPAYQAVASSNLRQAYGNPFDLSYRSNALELRNYLQANPPDSPIIMIGAPFGWYLTPGTNDLRNVTMYSPTNMGYFPLTITNVTTFAEISPTTLYVYNGNDSTPYSKLPNYMKVLIDPGVKGIFMPFKVVSRNVVYEGPHYQLLLVQLSWK